MRPSRPTLDLMTLPVIMTGCQSLPTAAMHPGFDLPLADFNQNQAARLRADAQLEKAVSELAAARPRAATDTREAVTRLSQAKVVDVVVWGDTKCPHRPLISHYQHLVSNVGMCFGPELIVRGAMERLGPILMTSACAALALIPIVWKGSVPGHEIEHPMAIVILGGLATSTIMNLLLLPALFGHFGATGKPAFVLCGGAE